MQLDVKTRGMLNLSPIYVTNYYYESNSVKIVQKKEEKHVQIILR